MDHYEVFKKQVSDKARKLIDEPVNLDLKKKNKYANNSSYVSESVYRRILNKISAHQWTFVPHEITMFTDTKKPYVRYIGLLIVPGFGVHTGIGTQSLGKNDDQNATAAAKTYAFKNACKEMGLAPNVGNEEFDEALFENIDDEEIDFSVEVDPPKKKAKKEKVPAGKPAPKKHTLKEQIAEVRAAYELDDDDDFVAFLQIWDEDIIDVTDMMNDDWMEFLSFLESNKDQFEDF